MKAYRFLYNIGAGWRRFLRFLNIIFGSASVCCIIIGWLNYDWSAGFNLIAWRVMFSGICMFFYFVCFHGYLREEKFQ